MKKSRIVVHCIVKNEERFIWYAINSVLPFVDKIMVWDTGSEDNTVAVIKTINSVKIDFKEVGPVDRGKFTDMRNEMLKETNNEVFDWLMILDGDEIWPVDALKKILRHIKTNPECQAVFCNTSNAVGDIYHIQPQSAGHYNIKGKLGHLGLRFLNLHNIIGLHVDLPYGHEGYYSGGNIPVQELQRVDFVNVSYLHTTHLKRSSLDKFTLNRRSKIKYELGEKILKSNLPEIVFERHPDLVPDISKHMDTLSYIRCLIETIPRVIKRYLLR